MGFAPGGLGGDAWWELDTAGSWAQVSLPGRQCCELLWMSGGSHDIPGVISAKTGVF